jgi:allantoinase
VRVIRGRRVATPDGLRPAAIHVEGERIAAVRPYAEAPPGAEVVEAGDALVFPGLVDTHVHVNEPGRSEWEGFASATRAAAAGGVTALLDMPLNSRPPTTTRGALEEKRRAAEGQCAVDVGFLGGAVPGNAAELPTLHEAGVFAFKSFLCGSGVDEFPPVSAEELRRVLAVLAPLGALLMVHAELPAELERAAERAHAGDPRSYGTWLAARPVAAEVAAVRLVVGLARETGARVHVVHVSSPEAAALVAGARAAGVRVTAETCPHYLTFAAEEIPTGATLYKCAPPVRDAAAREGLWEALAGGVFEAVVSDHSPAAPARRDAGGDFLRSWGGIASLQLRLPAVWTEARARGHGPERLLEWLCAGPARLAGLEGRKGAIAPGCDADLVLWHPDEPLVVAEDGIRHRHAATPWLGRRLVGAVEATWLRGELAFSRSAPEGPPRGRLLARSAP